MTKGERTKRRIIESTIQLFYSEGFEKVTFDQIAKSAQLTQPALYMYFESKINLLAACGSFAAQQGLQYIGSKINPMSGMDTQLKIYIEANFDWFFSNRPQAYSLLSIYYFANSSTLMSDLRKKIELAGIERITVFIQQGFLGKLWQVQNPNILARQIHSLMVGEVFKMYYEPENISLNERKGQILDLISKLLKYKPK